MLPAVQSGKAEPEPELAYEEYEFILSTLCAMSQAIERSPSTFAELSEEEIRNFILILLNSHYEGRATGETFNAGGKTDILIRENDRNVFIAECKIWKGAKQFSEAIDQLLRYLTWRDTKTAIVIFNRNKNSLAVINAVLETLEERNDVKKVEANTAYGPKAIVVKSSEPGKEILLTVVVLDI